MTVLTPLSGWLDDYLLGRDAGRSVTGMWHSSSVCVVRPTGHNSDSSQAQFDGGEYLFGYVELPSPSTVHIDGAFSLSLDPRGFEDYAADEPFFDDSGELFLSSSGLSDSSDG